MTILDDALAACRELIYGDGGAASEQRAIDLARKALGLDRRSILSDMPDGTGFFYGFYVDDDGRQDHRRIDVQETIDGSWNAYVGGDLVGIGQRKAEAELLAVEYVKLNAADV